MELKEKLVALRKEKGLTQSAVAEKLDVSRQAISRWESGIALPSTDNLKSLSALYGVPVDYLLNSDTEEQRVTKGLEAENIPMNGKRTKRNLWVVLSIVMIVLLLVACEIFLYVNNQEEGVDLHSIPLKYTKDRHLLLSGQVVPLIWYMQDGQSIWHLIRTILERYIFIMPVVLRRIIVMRKENLGKDTRGTKNMAIRLLEIIMEKRVAHQKIQKNTALISLSG